MSDDIGRNDPCHCGSGKKYKKCCLEKDETKEHAELAKKWKEAEAAGAKAEAESKPAPSNKPSHASSGPTSHKTSGVTPKFNIPRRTGGS